MKNQLFLITAILTLLLFSNTIFSQTLNLGILESFEGYTGSGGVANSGGTVTGDVGTNSGLISGFTPPFYTANIYNANAVTSQARYDLLRLYIHLNALSVNFPDAFNPVLSPAHGAAFGGEALLPGVYSIGSAGSVTGALTLDGGGDPNAVFVIKMNGALTIGAGAKISLTNGAKSSNVFWVINGAISVAAGAEVKGTLFSKAGAVGLGANVILEGRMLSLAGALTMGVGSSATPPPLPSTISIFCESNCAPAPAATILGVLSGFALFASNGNVANTGISGINGIIGTNAGAITGYTDGTHIGTQEIANALTVQAAADLDAAYNSLMAMTPSVTHAASFLNETLAPGVYHIPIAGALGGVVILDAANDPNAIFVFRFAGAFNIAAASKIILTNGARRCNVFWLAGAGVATGALNIGAASELQGTFISHGGACNSGSSVFMAGRQLSTLGAVNSDTAVIYNNPECVTSRSLNAPALAIVAAVNDRYEIQCAATSSLGNVLINDTIDTNSFVASDVIITLESGANANITLNTTTGDLSITNSLAYGEYTLGYKICQATNITNCSSGTITISLVQATKPAKANCSDTYTFTNCAWVKDNNTPTIR